ncbi:Ypt/Rab-GAP domain of gyp1p superfamily protein isoform 3 [Hibiscus syriacus]|uniref:Ypt/Rab-GAP domain of gyp1p superfamily protein isoform 3 n=1 Tax=Hibiscus syriacus TaxID=106335 RepID=A0A6A2YK34_HIBSY|nr:Ypt/Rab-GAP domain of gyp1p superfamily protein isoform 3 [Hibiscus syriacus]
MHELLAPLLYVLHIDVERLSEVRKLYEDRFIDKFDGFPFEENGGAYNFDFKKFSDSMEDEVGSQRNSKKVCSLYELDSEIQAIVLLSDAYGAEGELGIVLSEKFMEHDAYCMFDALMIGARGSVAMADFFASSPLAESQSGLPPVIEASAAPYHLLSIVDSSLHTHLVELGVEPQYFALRCPLDKVSEDVDHFSFKLHSSRRGALIAAMAVSMILYLRSSLLATETATSCLQRLLNFPEYKSGKSYREGKVLQNLLQARCLTAIGKKNGECFIRTESAPSPAIKEKFKKDNHSIRRSLLEDLSKKLGLEDDAVKGGFNSDDYRSEEVQGEGQNCANKDPPSPPGCSINDHENDTEKSSVTSNLSVDDNDDHRQRSSEDLPHQVPLPPEYVSRSPLHGNESSGKTSSTKERRHLSGKFQWFRKFGRSNVSEETSDKRGGTKEAAKPPIHDGKSSTADSSAAGASCNLHPTSKGDTVDQSMMGTLKNLGQAMLDQIQFLESVFQQDQVGSLENLSKNNLVGKGQGTTITALKELRKISKLLSEM